MAKDTAVAMGWEDAAEPPAPPAPVVEPPPAPAPIVPVPAPPAPPPEPTTAELIERTARATAAAMAPPTPTPAPPAIPPALEMIPEDAEDYRVLQFLEGVNPNYRGKANQYQEWLKVGYAYQDKWLGDHPDEQFDPNADEHKAFYAANPCPVTPKEVDNGRIEMLAEAAAERKYLERVKPDLDRQEVEKVWQKARPQVDRNVCQSVVDMVEAARPDLAKHLRDANGQPNLSAEAVNIVDAADPIAKSILDEIAENQLVPMVTELEKNGVKDLKYRLNPANNAIHAQIDGYRAALEEEIQKLPADQQLRDGRLFTTISRFEALKKAIEDGPGARAEKDQRLADLSNSRWCPTIDDLKGFIVDHLAELAHNRIEKIDGMAKRKYPNGAPQPPAPVQPPPEPPAPLPTPAASRGRPPSISSGADVVTTQNPGGGPPKSYGEQVADVHFK